MNLSITPGTLPSPFCPATWQAAWEAFAAAGSVNFPFTFAGVVVSASKPDPSVQGVNTWLQLDGTGRPVRLYWYASGSWLSQHPQVPGSTMIWTSALPDFTVFDGGDANALGVASGPMWEQVVALNAAFPVGVGTFPSGTAVAVGGSGGEEKHQLTIPELASHDHGCSQSTTGVYNIGSGSPTPGSTRAYVTEAVGGDTPHNNLPPYVGVYFLRRTTRVWYSVP